MSVSSGEPALTIEGVSCTYGPVQALQDVHLEARFGEVVGLVGENGAGKSTLLNVLSCVTRKSSGHVRWNGVELEAGSYREANELGIFRYFQEQSLIPGLAVYENLLLGYESRFRSPWGMLSRRSMVETAQDMLSRAGVDDIDPLDRVADLSPGSRELLETAKAIGLASVLGASAPLFLLDEPTTSLDINEGKRFFDLLRRLRGSSIVLFISHSLPEVIAVCDRIYVMKDGRIVKDVRSSETSPEELRHLMVGRARSASTRPSPPQGAAQQALVVDALGRKGAYENVSFGVDVGEIVGVAGIAGCGKEELARGIVGIDAPDHGAVDLGGHTVSGRGFAGSISSGLVYVPGERAGVGLNVDASILENIQLPSLRDSLCNGLGLWRSRKSAELAERWLTELDIKAEDASQLCSSLSGGNQQRVLLAKWLCREPKAMVIVNPTRGVDVGSRQAIYSLFRRLCDTGLSVLVVSDDLPELLELCSRILVMRRHRLVSEVDCAEPDDANEESLVRLMLDGR